MEKLPKILETMKNWELDKPEHTKKLKCMSMVAAELHTWILHVVGELQKKQQ